jgi:NDP-hexose-3-ketoreductase
MKPLGIAVWGVGRHATERILPAVASVQGLALRGVCGRDARRVEATASTWRCQAWTNEETMLGDADVHVVYVATATGCHAENAAAALASGKHVWCEKPFTASLRSTVDLVETSRRSGLAVCEGLMYLYHPQFRQLVALISDGSLGELRSISCRFGIPPLSFESFRSDPSRGGGALLDVGCYPISAIQALFPDAECRVAHARVSARRGSDVDTDGEAVVALSAGVVAQLEWRTGSAYRNEIGVWGDAGSVFTDRIFSKPADYEPVFEVRGLRGDVTLVPGKAANHFVAMLEWFSQSAHDPRRAEAERRRIVRSAELLDRIWNFDGGAWQGMAPRSPG